jgi:hypothetical protein
MKNWKTTVSGLLAAIGVYLSTIKDPPWLGTAGTVLMGVGAALTGFLAKDLNVTNAPTPGPAQKV